MPDDEKADETPEKQPKVEQADATDDSAGEKPPPQEADFVFLLRNLATQAFISLGEFPHPVSKQKEVDLESAKFSIDLIQICSNHR